MIDWETPSTLYAGTSNGVFKSTDSGESWTRTSNGLTNKHVFTLAIDPHTPTTIYAGARDYGVFKSTDGGMNWTVVNTGLRTTLIEP